MLVPFSMIALGTQLVMTVADGVPKCAPGGHQQRVGFARRAHGPGSDEIAAMLKREGVDYEALPRVAHEGRPSNLYLDRRQWLRSLERLKDGLIWI
jgi:hypothetical protein